MALGISYHSGPGYLLKLLHKPLVPAVMDMTVEHISSGIAILIQAILSVITDNGVMTEHYFALIIVQFFIGLHPLKAANIHGGFGYKTIVIALDQV